MEDTATLLERLLTVQNQLKAPKSQRNTFGNYNFRNCEDILEAVKPLLHEQKIVLTLSDEMVNIGSRYYAKAIATVYLASDYGKWINTEAFAREAKEKKGMDAAQITGSASSYARKYALNGLFNIDDTKDADTNEQHKQSTNAPNPDDKYKLPGTLLIKIKSLLNTLEVYDEKRTTILEQITSTKKAEELILALEEKVAAKKEPTVEPVE